LPKNESYREPDKSSPLPRMLIFNHNGTEARVETKFDRHYMILFKVN